MTTSPSPALIKTGSSHENSLKCFCGRGFSNPLDLEEHREARGHFPSQTCNEHCDHVASTKYDYNIQVCFCGKICEREDILQDHFIRSGHCSCSDCDLTFNSLSALNAHLKTHLHASEWRCCDCDRNFVSYRSLKLHLIQSAVHQKPYVRKPSQRRRPVKAAVVSTPMYNHECNECYRTFMSRKTLKMHQRSPKHKSLCSLQCPMGNGCETTFAALSALLNHLESGRCKSGTDADDVYGIDQLCDKDHTIHTLPMLTPANSAVDSVSSPSPPLELSDTPSSTIEDKSSLVSTTLSSRTLENSWSNIPVLRESFSALSLTALDNATTECLFQCPLCPVNLRRRFATVQTLYQHMVSPGHAKKRYHCPSILSGEKWKGGKERQFVSLGALASYVEHRVCYRGEKRLLHYIELVEQLLMQSGFGKLLEQSGFRGLRLLLPAEELEGME